MHRTTSTGGGPRSRRRTASFLVTLAGATLGLASIASATASPPATTIAPELTLRIGTDDRPSDDGPDRVTVVEIEEFARRVDDLSGGRIEIEPVWAAGGTDPHPEWDQVVARMVSGGELELGLIPTRAWDTEGVTTLRALNTPFLITSDSLVADVVSGPLADELMSGLERAGVVGLALMPDSLRHPFSLASPLNAPTDYEGALDPVGVLGHRVGVARGARCRRDRRSGRRRCADRVRVVVLPHYRRHRHRQRDVLPEGQLARRRR